MRYIYLHGFASGPQSRKAQTFRRALSAHNVELEIPDLAEGNFEHLTISRQLKCIENCLQGAPARMIGSSMGGYLAALYASQHPEIDRLVLLAPAFSFATRWQELLGPAKLRDWQQTGTTEVFHYGDNANRALSYELYKDSLSHPASPGFSQSAQIFHGIDDDVVPVAYSREFVARHPNAELHELPSGHELLNVLDEITSAAVRFLTAEKT